MSVYNPSSLLSDPELIEIAGLTPTNGGFIVGDGNDFVLEAGSTARSSLGLGTSNNVTFKNCNLSNGAIAVVISGNDSNYNESLGMGITVVDTTLTYPVTTINLSHIGNLNRSNTALRIHANETNEASTLCRMTGRSTIESPTYECFSVSTLGNIGIGTITYGSSARGVLAIANGTQGGALANAIQIVSEDLSAGNTIPSIRTEGSGIYSVGTTAVPTGSVAIKINGTVLHFEVSTTAAS
jgi:hypothetical protein